ncbi:MAG: OmpA family protein [Zoogloeaceae bacterium]|jgi:OOP family OmpA-OmpF porin|nr:OmpA family protein [Zoogloeaceae bacterium]
MNKKIATSFMVFALCASIGVVQAQNRVYVIDQRGAVATSGTGLCWRTGYWTPAAAASDPAGCQCDKDLLSASVCAPPAATPVAATPRQQAPVRPPVQPADEKITLPADALFDFNKDVLRPEGRAALDSLVEQVSGLDLEVITAVGHTDRIGKEAYNQRLSERRAASVKRYLISRGIEDNLIYTEGRGEAQPVTGEDCNGLGAEHGRNRKLVACLQPDRRVEIEAIGTRATDTSVTK